MNIVLAITFLVTYIIAFLNLDRFPIILVGWGIGWTIFVMIYSGMI